MGSDAAVGPPYVAQLADDLADAHQGYMFVILDDPDTRLGEPSGSDAAEVEGQFFTDGVNQVGSVHLARQFTGDDDRLSVKGRFCLPLQDIFRCGP